MRTFKPACQDWRHDMPLLDFSITVTGCFNVPFEVLTNLT